MGIESRHLKREGNPAWGQVEKLKLWLAEIGLPPETVKPFADLEEILSITALGAVSPGQRIFPDKLTPWEEGVSFGYPPKINNIPILVIADFDGVPVNLWEKNPDWIPFLNLRRIADKANRFLLWTNRPSPDENGLFWKTIGRLFDHPGAVDKFPFFTQQSVKAFQRAYSTKNSPEKTRVIWGPKWVGKRGFDQVTETMKEMGNPYVVHIGSGVFDIREFKRLISYCRENKLPYDRLVFCFNGHLFQ